MLKPQQVLESLQALTAGRDDMIWTTGVGQHQMWAMQYLLCDRPRSFITSGGLGTMGYGLPAAVGAKAARPDATVVCVDGDGCFQMTSQELATSVTEDLPIVVVIVNNGYLGMVRQWQDMFFEERFSQVHLDAGLARLREARRGVRRRRLSRRHRGRARRPSRRGAGVRPHGGRRLPRRPGRALLPDDPGGCRRPRPRRVRGAQAVQDPVIHTVSVLVEDKPGALMRISSMFARRGYNIESLAVGPTERPKSRASSSASTASSTRSSRSRSRCTSSSTSCASASSSPARPSSASSR